MDMVALGRGWDDIRTGLRGYMVPDELRAVCVRAIGGGVSGV